MEFLVFAFELLVFLEFFVPFLPYLLCAYLAVDQFHELLFVGRAVLRFLVEHILNVLRELFDHVFDISLKDLVLHLTDFITDLNSFLLPFPELGHFAFLSQSFVLGPPNTGEKALQGIVVLLEDGVELVVMALGAANAQSEKDFTRDVGHLVEDQFPLHTGIALVPFVHAMSKEARGDHVVVIVRVDLIACQLFANELIVGLVLVQAAQDIVSVEVGGGTKAIRPVPVGFGEADDVEPMGRPSLAVRSVSKQTIYKFQLGFTGIFFPRLDEGVDFIRGGRQAQKIEVCPANEFEGSGFLGQSQVLALELSFDEEIDRVARAINLSWSKGLNGPPILLLFGKLMRVDFLTGFRSLHGMSRKGQQQAGQA